MRIEFVVAVAATFVVTASGALAQQPPMGPPRVQVGVFSTRLDGGTGGGSASIGPSANESQFSGRLYLSACGSGMGTLRMTSHVPDLAIAVWEVRGVVTAEDGQAARIRLSWQRLRAGGQAVTEPATNTDYVLAPGNPVTIDSFTLSPQGECADGRSITLQARYESQPVFGGTFGGGGRGGGGVANVSTAAAVAAPAGSGGAAVRAGGGESFGARSGTDFRPFQTAELWLVHSSPGRSDEVFSTSTTASMNVGDFAFAPVAIQTERGLITVRITGTVEIGLDAAGKPALVFGARRRASFVPATRQPRDGDSSVESGGVANTVVAAPGPSEVLSFEMPPLQGAGLPSVPDGFAIRLRLTASAANPGR